MFRDFSNKMPAIDLSKLKAVLSVDDFALVKGIVATQGQNKGCLRAAKPKMKRGDLASGSTAYIWRMVAFFISPVGQHQCMPITADWDVPNTAFGYTDWREPWDRDGYKAHIAHLDKLVDVVVDSVPKDKWHGINRWGRALGY